MGLLLAINASRNTSWRESEGSIDSNASNTAARAAAQLERLELRPAKVGFPCRNLMTSEAHSSDLSDVRFVLKSFGSKPMLRVRSATLVESILAR